MDFGVIEDFSVDGVDEVALAREEGLPAVLGHVVDRQPLVANHVVPPVRVLRYENPRLVRPAVLHPPRQPNRQFPNIVVVSLYPKNGQDAAHSFKFLNILLMPL